MGAGGGSLTAHQERLLKLEIFLQYSFFIRILSYTYIYLFIFYHLFIHYLFIYLFIYLLQYVYALIYASIIISLYPYVLHPPSSVVLSLQKRFFHLPLFVPLVPYGFLSCAPCAARSGSVPPPPRSLTASR